MIVNKAFLCADIYFSLTGWNYLLVARHFCTHTRVFLRLTDIFEVGEAFVSANRYFLWLNEALSCARRYFCAYTGILLYRLAFLRADETFLYLGDFLLF